MHKIDYNKFREEFLATTLGQQVSKDFDILTCTNTHYPSILLVAHSHGSTCRELLGSRTIPSVGKQTTLSIVSFYYLQFLQEKNPKVIYDIGCGWNVWSRYIPNIVGIDNNSKYAHRQEDYNTDFVNKNYRKFESAFSINMSASMNKDPITGKETHITFENLADSIKEFSSIISVGGRGYFSIPAISPLISTSDDWFTSNNLTRYSMPELTEYVKKVILSQEYIKIIALDVELDVIKNLPSHDGEIRVVFEII